MLIHTTARHCELDADVRLFAEQRLGKLSKFARALTEAHLTVTAEGGGHRAEITLRLEGRDIVSRELSNAEGPRAVSLDENESVSLMINEEDHIRLQVMRSGLALSKRASSSTAADPDALSSAPLRMASLASGSSAPAVDRPRWSRCAPMTMASSRKRASVPGRYATTFCVASSAGPPLCANMAERAV